MLEHPKPPDQEPSCRCGCQLLRSDIHTLFDLGKIGIHPDTRRVVISEALRGTVYASATRIVAQYQLSLIRSYNNTC
jgi:hypothetical protein